MKLENKTTQVESTLGGTVRKAKIAEANLGKLWTMLQSPYKNSIGAIVREITSNCVDAQKANGVTDAIIIEFTKDESGIKIAFKDKGTGLSPQKIDDIYMNYLASDKDASDEFLGAFGIGSKSPLSYVDAFYIDTRVDGKEWHYIMSKGETSPELTELSTNDTTEVNGTTISMYLKEWKIQKQGYYSSVVGEDFATFVNEIYKQLFYFTNVYVILDKTVETYYSHARNDYNTYFYKMRDLNESAIYKTDLFSYRANSDFREAHLTLGPVAYPIDTNQLSDGLVKKLEALPPIALNFDIGSLPVIPTREDVNYGSKATAIAIEKKVDEFIEFITNYMKEHYEKECDTFSEYVDLYIAANNTAPSLTLDASTGLVLTFFPKDLGIDVTPTYKVFNKYGVEYAELIGESVSGWSSRSILGNLLPFYKTVKQGKVSVSGYASYSVDDYTEYSNVYLLQPGEKYSVSKNKYICSPQGMSKFKIDLRHRHPRTLAYYKDKFNLGGLNKNKWRAIIQTVQAIEEEVIADMQDYSKVTLSSEYKKHLMSNRTTLAKEVVVLKSAFTSDKYRFTGEEVGNRHDKILFLYGHRDDEYLRKVKSIGQAGMDHIIATNLSFNMPKTTIRGGSVDVGWESYNLFRISKKPFKVKVVEVAKSKIKYIKDLPNTISAEEFMKTRKYFRRMARGIYISMKMQERGDNETMALLNVINPTLKHEFKEFVSKDIVNGSVLNSLKDYHNDVLLEIVEMAKEQGESFSDIDKMFEKLTIYDKYNIKVDNQPLEGLANIIRYFRFCNVPLGKEFYLKYDLPAVRKVYQRGTENDQVLLKYLELEGKVSPEDYQIKETKTLTY